MPLTVLMPFLLMRNGERIQESNIKHKNPEQLKELKGSYHTEKLKSWTMFAYDKEAN